MSHWLALLGVALIAAIPACADDAPPMPVVSDPFFASSPDPLTQRVLSTQIADQNGGVVSAVLLPSSDPSKSTSQPRVSYEGKGTSTDGLNIQPGKKLVKKDEPGASDIRDAAGPKPEAEPKAPKPMGQSTRAERACRRATQEPAAAPAVTPADSVAPSDSLAPADVAPKTKAEPQ